MAQTFDNFATGLSEIGGYRVIRTLSEQNWVAEAAGGRKVVLKVLDEDCLWKGQLHPNVKDRLARVRELAHSGVANLYGVERDGALTYLVWEYVEGVSLEEFAVGGGFATDENGRRDARTTMSKCSGRDLLLLARELVLSVEVLHARGIVHGQLKASNVIINPEGRAVLTHVSPLLYSNPGQDVSTLITTLLDLLEVRGEADSVLGRILQQAAEEECSLRRLAVRLGAAIDARDAEPGQASQQVAADKIKRRAMMGAGATALVGIALFFGLKQYASARTPKAPVAPQAAPAALQPPAHGEHSTATVATRAAS